MCMMVSRRSFKEKWGKVSCEAGNAQKSKMKKSKKAGEQGSQMAAQCDEEQRLEEMLERKRIERNSWNWDAMQKGPELVVHETNVTMQ